MNMAKARDRVLKLLFLDTSTYHDASTTGAIKNVLCSIDAQYSCPQGDQALPGRCVMRSEKPVTWTEASNFCRDQGSSVVVIHNRQENKAFTELLREKESGWLLPSHGKTWSAEEDTIDYWFTSENSMEKLKCSSSQHAVITNGASEESCSTYGKWTVDDDTNKNIAICVKNAECPMCPTVKEPVVCVGPGKYVNAKGVCGTCESNAVPKGKTCEVCAKGSRPDYNLNQCVDDYQITCDSFVDIPGEVHPCYCDQRSKGKLTTNGLCRRKGSPSKDCGSGLIDVAGMCVGTAAIHATTRNYCLSLMAFRSGTCVANEMLHLGTVLPTAAGVVEPAVWCASQLKYQGQCHKGYLNVSIRAGRRSFHVVYFPTTNDPVFIGHQGVQQRNIQETYGCTPPVWPWPRCSWAEGGIGWSRDADGTGCVHPSWKVPSEKCPESHSIEISGKGGTQCFGRVIGSYAPVWENYGSVWTKDRTGIQLPEREYLHLPRVVIAPGEWMPERFLAACPIGTFRQYDDACVPCANAPKVDDFQPRNAPLSCASFTNISTETLPCFCEERTKGRFTTNGLCRRIGKDPCAKAGLIDVAGVCVGADAIITTTRNYCLSLLIFKTGTCVANEMLYEKVQIQPTCSGKFVGAIDCGTQLRSGGGCVTNPYNVSIRAGRRAFHVVYFPSTDDPVFIGHQGVQQRHIQETYACTPVNWNYPRCNHAQGYIGWSRDADATGCVENDWRVPSEKCKDIHTIEISGSGGSQCFGQAPGAYAPIWANLGSVWTRVPAPAQLPEKDYLNLPRVVIVPGEWQPERVK